MKKPNYVGDSMEECIAWLRNLVLFTSGKEELQTNILKFQRYPNLVCRLEKILNPSNIPPPTTNWKASVDLLPFVTEQTFSN